MKTWHLGLAGVLGLALSGCASQGTSVGSEAPDITVESLATKQDVKLSSLRGKVVVLDFWATWCGPCIQSMPHIESVVKEYKDQGVVSMMVTDEGRDLAERFANEMSFDVTYYRDPFRTANSKYNIDKIPATFVIGRDGKVVYEGRPADPAELKAAVESAVKG